MPQRSDSTAYTTQLLDEIIYLTSLVSQRDAVDPLLDPMRIVTSTVNVHEQELSKEDLQTLEKVRADVTQYILTKEQVREFTAESLQAYVASRGKVKDPGKSLRKQLATVFGLSIGASLLSVAIPAPPQSRGLLASSLFLVGIRLGAAWFFLSALNSFSANVQRAYQLICVGVALFALMQLLQPMIEFFGLRDWPYVSAVVLALMLPVSICFYLGVRLYARSVNVQGRVASWRFVTPVIAVAALASIVIPHRPSSGGELYFDAIIAADTAILVLAVMASLVMYQVKQRIVGLYADAAAKLWHFLLSIAFAALYMLGLGIATGEMGTGPGFVVAIVTFVISGFLLIRAGYAFAKIGAH